MAKRFAVLLCILASAPAFAEAGRDSASPGSTTTVTLRPDAAVSPGTTRNAGAAASPEPFAAPRSRRSPAFIVGRDALYGGVAGALVGGGMSLVGSGSSLKNNLLMAGGLGTIAGIAWGFFDVGQRSQTSYRAEADRDPAACDKGFDAKLYTLRY